MQLRNSMKVQTRNPNHYLWSWATNSQISIFFAQSISASFSLVAKLTSSVAIFSFTYTLHRTKQALNNQHLPHANQTGENQIKLLTNTSQLQAASPLQFNHFAPRTSRRIPPDEGIANRCKKRASKAKNSCKFADTNTNDSDSLLQLGTFRFEALVFFFPLSFGVKAVFVVIYFKDTSRGKR